MVPEAQLKFLPLFLFVVAIVGVVASEKAIKETGVGDPPCVVIDEWLGQGVTLLAVPHTLFGVVFALMIFRFFDILKPPPIRWLEKAPGGLGIMLDDMGAGILGYLVIWAAYLIVSGR
jgi:phosphatidylglycerophosphatase A